MNLKRNHSRIGSRPDQRQPREFAIQNLQIVESGAVHGGILENVNVDGIFV